MNNPLMLGIGNYIPEIIVSLPKDKDGNPPEGIVNPRLIALIVLFPADTQGTQGAIPIIHDFGEVTIENENGEVKGNAVAIYNTLGQLRQYLLENYPGGIWVADTPELEDWQFLKPLEHI